MSGFLEAVRKANAPKPPEHSIALRTACTAAIAVGLLSAAAEHEISRPVCFLTMSLIAAGMTFSYRVRDRSLGWVKLLVAAGALTTMAWFIHRLFAGPPGDITGVENPLTILFAWILVVHSFHVPARRDLVFALAGSAALMAVAGAQAVDMNFGLYALAWASCGLWALFEVGASASGGARPRPVRLLGSTGAVIVAAVAVFLALPAPTAAVRLDFRSAAGPGGAVPGAGRLAGDSGSPLELSHPGSSNGRTRVGGYLGFAGSLDTAARAALGKTVVMQVRASVPTYWIGETFDHWNGQDWSSTLSRTTTLSGGSPFALPTSDGNPLRPGIDDLQTFYIKDATADLIFHADSANQLWFPADKVYAGQDGSLISPIGLGKGAIYTVDSNVDQPTPAELRAAAAPRSDMPQVFLQLPKQYSDVHDLAESVTADDTTEYDTVQSLIAWIGSHTRYSTDIPPLAPGKDAVEEFLFGNRTGYCEQISTALTVMLRTLGIPAREAVGYVPGPYNPITDLYQVRAEDAHAWVQAYFPGYGWVSFDPTAAVPDANPSPGLTALHIAGRWVASLPWVPMSIPFGAVAAGAGVTWLVRRRRAARRLSPAEIAVRRMERAGRRAGRPRTPSETVVEYGTALRGGWPDVARAVEAAAYGGLDIPAEEWEQLLQSASSGVTTRTG